MREGHGDDVVLIADRFLETIQEGEATAGSDTCRAALGKLPTIGCSVSATTEWLVGRSLDDARGVGPADIDEAVGGMPEAKRGCVQMAADAARQAAQSVA